MSQFPVIREIHLVPSIDSSSRKHEPIIKFILNKATSQGRPKAQNTAGPRALSQLAPHSSQQLASDSPKDENHEVFASAEVARASIRCDHFPRQRGPTSIVTLFLHNYQQEHGIPAFQSSSWSSSTSLPVVWRSCQEREQNQQTNGINEKHHQQQQQEENRGPRGSR